MKIAILTQPLINNYGGNVQNYALQTVLREMGHEPTTVDRHYSVSLTQKLRLGFFKNIIFYYLAGSTKPNWRRYFQYDKEQQRVRRHIVNFINKHIKKTDRLYSDNAVRKKFKDSNFDAVVVGSDQVWRPIYSPNIYTYYLDFLENNKNIKKIAYAASFGTHEWEYTSAQSKRCKELVHKFDLITSRERAGVQLLQEKFNVKATFVADPTLLLTKEHYETLFEGKELKDRNGIYTYILDDNEWKRRVVDAAKNQLNLSQYSNQHNEHAPIDTEIPSIEGWLKGFSDADFVITDSFHGTVFSIIFEKPFISLINRDRGASRFESIAIELGLTERLIEEFDEDQVSILLNKDIDKKQLKEKLAKLKENSRDLLDFALSS